MARDERDLAAIRSSAIALQEPPAGRYRAGHCWWCGAELADKEDAIRRGRAHCYPDREGRDCVRERRSSVVYSARAALRGLFKETGRLVCPDCGTVVAEVRDACWVDLCDWEADHEVPLEQGGPHVPANFRPRCAVPCHAEKTARESRQRAATRRARLTDARGELVLFDGGERR